MELKRASLIINTPPVTPRNSLLLSAPHSAGPSSGGYHLGHTPGGVSLGGGGGGGGERMFDLQEFLMRGFESGDVRQSITEVDEGLGDHGLTISRQSATDFHQSQGSGMSSSQGGLSQGLSQSLSQHSEGKSSSVGGAATVELNMSANSNNNNSNNNDSTLLLADDDGGGGLAGGGGMVARDRSESFMSMEDILSEFDAGVGAALLPPAAVYPADCGNRLSSLLPSYDSSSTTNIANEATASFSLTQQPPPSQLAPPAAADDRPLVIGSLSQGLPLWQPGPPLCTAVPSEAALTEFQQRTQPFDRVRRHYYERLSDTSKECEYGGAEQQGGKEIVKEEDGKERERKSSEEGKGRGH